MKNIFSNKKRPNKGILEFLNRKGFYLVLILGIFVVGVTAILLTKPNLKFFNFITNTEDNFIPEDFEDYLDYLPDVGEEEDINENGGVNEANIGKEANVGVNTAEYGQKLAIVDNTLSEKPKSDVKDVDVKDVKDVNDVTDVKPKEEESSIFLAKNDENNENNKVAEVEKPDFIMPVYGNIIYDFAVDKLVYSKTLEDWRTHKGIDIAAARGTAVKASAGGIVCEIKNDPRLGNTIVIDHDNGFKTVYSNLASLDMVLPNQIVAQGESIGSVGDTAIFEIALEPHLHFEVLKQDVAVDPKLYLPGY
ncbi:MAG: M23 family metallopeptidase [Firmicutes bacterium]|nr:M23 family metallopeptidase [Bacillota bacterium]